MTRTYGSILKVIDLKTYFYTRHGVVKAVEGVNFELRRGECLCLVGESGCGKSVSALSILRLIDSPPGEIVSGQALYNNLDLIKCSSNELRQIRGKEIAMVFQDAQSAMNPVFTVGDQIIEQIKLHLGLNNKEARIRAKDLLTEMGIPDAERALSDYPHQLSGGMRQRAMIAMSLSCDPQILIADEPTTAVDVTIKAQILQLFQDLKAYKQMSFIFITHDLGVVSEIGDRAVVIYAGKDIETAPVSEIINSPKHPYTIGLLECLPDISRDDEKLPSIPGTTPSPIELPQGCSFHPRCTHVMDICRLEEPPKVTISKEHTVSCHLFSKKR
ncbi:ABC transporter ATP-binding protein [Chloroflexota bacterium]